MKTHTIRYLSQFSKETRAFLPIWGLCDKGQLELLVHQLELESTDSAVALVLLIVAQCCSNQEHYELPDNPIDDYDSLNEEIRPHLHELKLLGYIQTEIWGHAPRLFIVYINYRRILNALLTNHYQGEDLERQKQQRKRSRKANHKARMEKIKHLRSIPYATEYLKSEHWQRLKLRALKRARFECLLCTSKKYLQVHHKTYERLGCERLTDLTVLCKSCHSKFHDKPSK